MADYAVILAGGQGTRLWPLSRATLPKQFLALAPGGHTLLQEAVRRATAVVGTLERVLVLVQANQAELARAQLPDLPPTNLIREPAGRNTAASLGLAALHVQDRAAEAVMGVFPADHLFADEIPWLAAVRAALAFAGASQDLVTIGIPPAAPSDHYGYLKIGLPLSDGLPECCPVFRVQQFIEKPDRVTAQVFIASGAYLWNTGTFAWRTPVFLDALRQNLPELFAGLQRIAVDLADWERLAEVYPTLDEISVDYGVMERSTNVAAVRGSFQRIDVGTLANLADIMPVDAAGNSAIGDLLPRNSHNNIVYSDEGLVGLIEVDDLIVVRQGDIVLVCPKERAGEVKNLVAMLRTAEIKDWQRYL